MSDFDLNALIDRALTWKEPDPHVIARRLVSRIPESELREVIASLLGERVALRLRMQRNLAPGQIAAAAHTRRAGGESRWKRYGPRLRYAIQGDWKFRDDLTPEDCDWLAEDYAQRAASNAAMAAQFRTLAAQLRAAGVARVADLDVLPEELAA